MMIRSLLADMEAIGVADEDFVVYDLLQQSMTAALMREADVSSTRYGAIAEQGTCTIRNFGRLYNGRK